MAKEKVLRIKDVNSLAKFFGANDYIILAMLIIIVAACIRFLGINFGLPYEHYWDEPQTMSTAINMMKTGDYNPHFFNYPSLYIYLELINSILCYLYAVSKGILISLGEIKTKFDIGWHWEISHPIFFLWGRALTALFGAATVFIVYLLGKRLKNVNIALVAAIFLTFAPGHVYFSKVIATDVPMAFFVALTVYISVLGYQQRKTVFFILAGLSAGLTAATKYNGGIVLCVPLLTAIFASFEDLRFFQRIFLIIISFALGFFIGCPYSPLDLPKFLTDLGSEVRHYKIQGHLNAEGEPGFPQFFHYLKYFYKHGYGLIPTILAGIGIISGMFRIKKNLFFLLLVFPVVYIILMCSQKVNFIRNMMCIIPFLALFSSIGFLFVIDFFVNLSRKSVPPTWLKWRNIFVLGLLIIAILTPLLKSMGRSWKLYTMKETRVVASEWLAQYIPAGSNVLFMSQLHFFKPHIFGKQYKAIINDKIDRSLNWYVENNIDYIVTSDAHDDPWLKDKSLVEKFNVAFKEFPVLKTIPGSPLSLSVLSRNPSVKILKVPKVPISVNKQIYNFNLKSFNTTPAELKYHSSLGFGFYWNGKASSYLISLSKGTYRFLINARGTPALGVKPIMRVDLFKVVGEKEISVFMHEFNVINIDTFKVYVLGPMNLEEGNYRIEISFINDLCVEKDNIQQDRNLFVKNITLKRL
jgi:4-amino-4-deoxy-L-arabinose transferase-like glycosyltransferase